MSAFWAGFLTGGIACFALGVVVTLAVIIVNFRGISI